jgi:hypothetical protein
MKKFLSFLIFVLFIQISYCQINGVNFQDAENIDQLHSEFETFNYVNLEGEFKYFYSYPFSTTGLRHCMENMLDILYVNNVNYHKPVEKDEFLERGLNIDSVDVVNPYNLDYQLEFDKLHNSFLKSLENDPPFYVKRVWIINGYNVTLSLMGGGYFIFIQ